MTDAAPSNHAVLTIRSEPLVGAVLGRVVGMLAARAQCPIDRLDDAMLVTDALAAHAGEHTVDGVLRIRVATEPDALEMRVGPLKEGGARQIISDAELPGIGNVLERVTDSVGGEPAADGSGEELVIRLAFAA
jgi:serine/threonine-protein kinase RsbW